MECVSIGWIDLPPNSACANKVWWTIPVHVNMSHMPTHLHIEPCTCKTYLAWLRDSHILVMHKDYGLSTSHSCAKCPADIHNYPYTQVTKDASWFARCYTVEQFKLRFPDRCEVFNIPGVTHDTVGADTMHNKHLGMDVYFCGSVLYLLVYVMLPGVWGCS